MQHEGRARKAAERAATPLIAALRSSARIPAKRSRNHAVQIVLISRTFVSPWGVFLMITDRRSLADERRSMRPSFSSPSRVRVRVLASTPSSLARLLGAAPRVPMARRAWHWARPTPQQPGPDPAQRPWASARSIVRRSRRKNPSSFSEHVINKDCILQLLHITNKGARKILDRIRVPVKYLRDREYGCATPCWRRRV